MGVADPDQIDPGEPLFNMGLDSLMALELVVLLEKNLGITLTEALVFEHPTIEDLVTYFLSVLFPEQAAAPSAVVVPQRWLNRRIRLGMSSCRRWLSWTMTSY